jgi:hypothetical protein
MKQSAGHKEYVNRPNPHFLDADLLNRFLEIGKKRRSILPH